jgi:hypothetical protein
MINKTYTANVYKDGKIIGNYVATIRAWSSPMKAYKAFQQWAKSDGYTFADFSRVK